MYAEIIDRKAPYKKSADLETIDSSLSKTSTSQDPDPDDAASIKRQITKSQELNVTLDILGQQPLLKIYTQICLCYPLSSDEYNIAKVTQILKKGLDVLAANFPWLAGQVIEENGIIKIVPFEKTPRLVIKDLRQNAWNWEMMQQKNFPFSMLDESIFCPRNTIPGMPNETEEQKNTAPVLYIQASFIDGGLILSFVAHHGTMDMTGQGHVIDLFSKACSNTTFTDKELQWGNCERVNIIPFLDDSWHPGAEFEHQVVKPQTSLPAKSDDMTEQQSSSPAASSWAYFSFSTDSLSSLKSIASESLFGGVEYISTDDAVTAFIWQATIRARLPRLDPNLTVNFARAVDARRYLEVPPEYPGLVQNMTYHSSPVQELVDEKLGVIASHFRMRVDPKQSKLAYETRALATMMMRSDDKSSLSFTASLNLDSDIMLSSWAKVNCYSLDFGLGLGLPVAVRRPQFTAVESLMYLMPRRPDGEYVAGLCLREEDMERLKTDQEFAKYATFIG